MKLIQITETEYYFQGAVNIGYVLNDENGMLIDAGLDKQTMKKVIKVLDEKGLPITHLFITHAHADHYGGARYLQEERKVYTFAPKWEDAILTYPILEPLYLYQGNMPLKELRNKFLEGPAIEINEVVEEGEEYSFGNTSFTCYAFPGHSLYQLGIKVYDVLFAADAYFGQEALKKHKIPFLIDACDALHSLKKLKDISCIGAVPGHGAYEEQFIETVVQNEMHHQKIINSIRNMINEQEIMSYEQFVQQLCQKWDVSVTLLPQYLLYRTAATAYLNYLIKNNEIEWIIDNLQMKIKKKA